MSTQPRWLYGHRGACAERPENTLPSFEHAIAVGADVIETDAHMTRDGHIVIAHDAEGTRAGGDARLIRELSLAQVQEWDAGWSYIGQDGGRPYAAQGIGVPRLAEVLERLPQARFNIDIKQRTPDMTAAIVSLLREHGAEERVTLASFHGAVIRAVRALGYRGLTALAGDEVPIVLAAPRLLCRRWLPARAAVQIPIQAGPVELGSRRFIEKCHALGFRVDYWIINDPSVADVLLDRGADGIITDDPAGMRSLVDRYR